MEIDDSDTEEADEMNIIDNDADVDSDIDAEDQLRSIFPFCLDSINWKYCVYTGNP